MLLGFKQRFAPFVEDGTKLHTIRAKRKVRPKVGEICHCYVNPRQKTMRLLRRSVCVRVDEITIFGNGLWPDPLAIEINGHLLSRDEARDLAWLDGFRSHPKNTILPLGEMAAFWKVTHGMKPGDVFVGDLIHWSPEIFIHLKWAEENSDDG